MATGTDNQPDAGDSETKLVIHNELVFEHFFGDGSMCFVDDTTGVYVLLEALRGDIMITYDINPDDAQQFKNTAYTDIWSLDLEEYVKDITITIQVPPVEEIPNGVSGHQRAQLVRLLLREGFYAYDQPILTEPAGDTPLDILDFGADSDDQYNLL